jgi:signal transduction histidine kinase
VTGAPIDFPDRSFAELLASMTHELRTPLNAIIGFTSLLHDGKVGPLSAEQTEFLGDILTSSRHLLQLINDVLDLAKVESGKMEQQVETVELSTVAREVKDIVRGLADQKRIRLDTEVSAQLPPVTLDPRLLKQVLYNYLSNAIELTGEGGRVSLRILPETEETFRVEVNGVVEAQGGTVAVRSVLGKGSTFTAILPRQVAAPGRTRSD